MAGRRLGIPLYTSTMAAVVIGGASTVGGVGLGYKYGISGMWLVVAIAVGLLVLSLLFSSAISRLKVFTVAEMLKLRYGVDTTCVSGAVMMMYTLMLTVTSTIAYATVFNVLFGFPRLASILLGGAVVVAYSSLGGMWSITLTDVVQFIIKTIGIFALLLPFAWNRAGGFDGIKQRLGNSFFDIGAIGWGAIATQFVVYSFGMLIGQDIWQRVFTAKSPSVAKWGGAMAGVYCAFYGVAGALIGMAAAAIMPGVDSSDDVYADVAVHVLPAGLSGIVLAGAVAAMMSTASGALIATATVARHDVAPLLSRLAGRPIQFDAGVDPEHDVRGNRIYVFVVGVVAVLVAALISDVISALTIAYDILVGGLLVAILGGLVWKRATAIGALASMTVGTAATLGTMIATGDTYANMPVYAGLGCSFAVYVAVSLMTTPTPASLVAVWNARIAGLPDPDAQTRDDDPAVVKKD